MQKLEIERADFDKLITRLRKRGVIWSTWRIEGTMRVYTGRSSRRIVREEIKALKDKKGD